MGRKRSKLFGVGVNDGKPRNEGCSYYRKWKSMLERCYSDKCQTKHPTYIGCTVCDEWLLLSEFTEWMKQQDWEGKEMDKDILIPGNKVYSPDTCVFVCRRVNALLNDHGRARGEHPQGVYFDSLSGKFKAQCCEGAGKRKHIGLYDSSEDAHSAYIDYKVGVIRAVSDDYPDIRGALLRHADALENSVTKLQQSKPSKMTSGGL